jgi:malate permease and related proteins
VIGVAAASCVRGGSFTAALAVRKTPAVVAFLVAVACDLAAVPVPPAIARASDLLGAAIIGVMLLGLDVQSAEAGLPRPNLDTFVASGVRLIAGSLIASLVAIPFGLTGPERSAGMIQAATPIADFVTASTLLSTELSLGTIAIVMYLI